MNRFDIFPEIVILRCNIDIGHITTLSARKYDFFPERTILFEDDFSEVFRSGQRAEKSGSASTDNNYVVHNEIKEKIRII